MMLRASWFSRRFLFMPMDENAKALGAKGGKARAKRLSAERRKEIAAHAAKTRWGTIKVEMRADFGKWIEAHAAKMKWGYYGYREVLGGYEIEISPKAGEYRYVLAIPYESKYVLYELKGKTNADLV